MKKLAFLFLIFLLALMQQSFAEPVSKKSLSLSIQGNTYLGLYTGETNDKGKPDGYGIFDAKDNGNGS